MTVPTPVRRARFWPRSADVGPDLGAGITVALVSVAEGMAYALVAGVDPIYGLYAGSICVIVGALFASSTLMMVTATNALALVTADKLGVLGPNVDPARALATLTLLVGVVMAGLGLLRLGSLIRFISTEIQAGLVAAVALLILLGQYKDLVGYSSKVDGSKVRKAIDITAHIGSWSWPTVAVGFGCIVVLILAKRTPVRAYADIIALVLGTVVVAAFHLKGVETVKDIATIPTGWASLPTPHLPDFSLVPALIPGAIAAAIVGLSEAATVGAAFPNPSGRRSDASRDFLAQGAGNIVGGFFRTMVAGGSLSRTGVNASAGARSRWSGIYAGVLLLVLVAVAGKLAELIPLCTLAAILIVIGFETLVKEVGHLLEARFVSWPHLIAAGVTVVVGVFSELTTAIFTGVALSLVLYTLTMADRAKVVAVYPVGDPDDPRWRQGPPPAHLEPGTTTVIGLTGAAYFASVYRASQAMPDATDSAGAALILEMRGRHFYSLNGIDYVHGLIKDLQRAGVLVVLADVQPDQRHVLAKTGILAEVGEDHVTWRTDILGEALGQAWTIAQRWRASSRPTGSPGEPAGDTPNQAPPAG